CAPSSHWKVKPVFPRSRADQETIVSGEVVTSEAIYLSIAYRRRGLLRSRWHIGHVRTCPVAHRLRIVSWRQRHEGCAGQVGLVGCLGGVGCLDGVGAAEGGGQGG